MKKWIEKHPDLWKFILFNLLANCATVTNFILMWLFKFSCGNYCGPDCKFCCAEEFCIQIKCSISDSGSEVYRHGYCACGNFSSTSGLQPEVFCKHWRSIRTGTNAGECLQYCRTGDHKLSINEILDHAGRQKENRERSYWIVRIVCL